MNSFEDSWNRNKSDETWFNKDVAERIFNEQQKKINEALLVINEYQLGLIDFPVRAIDEALRGEK